LIRKEYEHSSNEELTRAFDEVVEDKNEIQNDMP
jgi:hypothetical protein